MNSDLTRRIAFTLGALLVYRIGLHIPRVIILEIISRVQEAHVLRTGGAIS
jgi:preprotein translocase subunit SecY